jgi:hypothetical protein
MSERDAFYSTLGRFSHFGEQRARALAYQASLAIRQSIQERKVRRAATNEPSRS